MKKILILFILFPFIAFSQGVKFRASAPSYVDVNEQFSIRYTLTVNTTRNINPKFNYPTLDNFEILNINRSVSTSTSIQIINGQMTTNNQQTITWNMYLYAKKPGTYTIPPATVVLNGKKYNSNELTITVGNSTNNNLPQPKANPYYSQNQPEDNYQVKTNKNLFLQSFVNKKTVYVGEPIYFVEKLYSIYGLDLLDFKPGTFDGFFTQDFPQNQNIQPQRKVINGKEYLVADLEKKLIFPQKAGQLTISPYYVKVQIIRTSFWGFSVPDKIKDLYSPALTINVKPLPEQGKPADFSGAVGSFKIKSQIDKTNFKIDEPITLKVIISGTGNFGLFDDPQIQMPASFEKLDPKISDNLSLTAEGLKGEKIYEFIFIPRAPGNFTIPPISFSYFDPKQKKYLTLKTSEINITVEGQIDSTKAYVYSSGQTLQQLGSDIQYIYTNKFNLKKANNFLIKNKFFWLSYLLIIILFLIALYLGKKYIKIQENTQIRNFKKADKISRKILKNAEKLLKQNKTTEFYQAIEKALSDYVSLKFNIPKAELSLEKIRETFKNKNIPEDITNQYISIINNTQKARYAPEIMELSPQDLLKQSYSLISKIEKNF